MLNKLDTLIKLFPLIFIILTTLGYIHLQTYYYFFDIEILNYLELTEIILFFFSKSIIIITTILIIISITYATEIKKENEYKNKEIKIKSESKILDKLGIFIIIFLGIYILINCITGNYIGLIYPVGYGVCFLIFYLLEKYFFERLLSNNTEFFFLSFNLSIVVFLLINLNTITTSIERGYNIRNNNLVIKEVHFTYNNKNIDTSKQILYIGETKKNIFFFNSKTKETIIYKMENVDNLIMKNK